MSSTSLKDPTDEARSRPQLARTAKPRQRKPAPTRAEQRMATDYDPDPIAGRAPERAAVRNRSVRSKHPR